MKITPFDVTEHLDNDEVIAEYLTIALEEENPDMFFKALGEVAKARGMTHVAEKSGLTREGLYQTFSPGAKPHFETIIKITKALGIPFVPMSQRSQRAITENAS